jgi:hypothetical protein
MSSSVAGFENPIKKLRNNSVEADPDKVYALNEKNGPWLILLCSFNTNRMKDAANKANTLVYELRKNFKLKAYVFAGEFNLNLKNDLRTDPKLRNSDKSRARNKIYAKEGVFTEYVVLVGDYQSPDELQNDLEKIRNISPECMFKMFPKSVNRQPFPMPLAVPNPIVPASYIAQSDDKNKFIERLNEKRDFSLLSCPRKYTVQIATFTGRSIFIRDNINNNNNDLNSKLFGREKQTQLKLAEVSAEKLCKALRKQGIEAYQFHDQFSSIVTVGGFDYYNLANNSLRPEIVEIMNRFRGKPIQTGNSITTYSYIPVTIEGIECDMSPKVIEIPHKNK